VCKTDDDDDDDDASPLALPPDDDSEERMPPVELGIRFMSMYENMVAVVNGAPRLREVGEGLGGEEGEESSLSQHSLPYN